MRADWLAILATCSSLAVVTGLAAFRGADPEAGRKLIVIGSIGLLCALAEHGVSQLLGR